MRRDTLILSGLVFLFLILFFAFYPKIAQVSDESEYLRNAYFLTKGITHVTEPEQAYNFVGAQGIFFSRYPLTGSLFLVPFLAGGLSTVFLFGLFFFLLGLYFFVKLLDSHELSRLWAVVYLGYVPFLLHSTTLMQDLASMSLVLGSFLYYSRKKYVFMSVCLGTSILFKVTNILAAVLFLFVLHDLWKKQELSKGWKSKSCKHVVTSGVVFVGFFCIVLVHNYLQYGGLTTGYSFLHNNTQFIRDPLIALTTFFHYLVYLVLFYPGMLLVCLSCRFALKREILTYTTLLLFFISLVNNPVGLSINEFLFSYRYLFPCIPLLMFGYVSWLQTKKIQWNLVLPIAGIVLLLASAPVLYVKQQSSVRAAALVHDLYANTDEGSLIIGVQESNYFNEMFGNRSYVGILRPVGFENGTRTAEEAIARHGSYYVLYLETPYYDYKAGIPESQAVLDSWNRGELVLNQSYPLQTRFFSNTISARLYRVNATAR